MKRKTLVKRIATTGLAAAMALSMSLPVFAADATKVTDTEVVVSDGSNAKIEKDLSIAKKGVTAPEATYTFNFSAVTDGAPEISAKTASTTASSTQDTENPGKITVKTSDLLSEDDINKFNTPGIYEYNVTESTKFDGADTDHVLTSDDSIYRIKVKVAYVDNKLTVTGITAQKVESTDAKSSNDNTAKLTSITFNNKYTEYGNDDPTPNPDDPENPTPADDSKGLVISKTIGTTGGEDKSAKFTYTITFTKDDVNEDNPITAGTEVKNGENSVTNLEYNTPYTFELGDGNSISFKVPAGTEYTVTETTDGYTAKSVTTTNGTKAATEGGAEVTSYVGEKANSVAFTNTKDSSPLTGIVNNYGGLIAVVAIAAGGMVVLTLRRRREDV